jgi:hypothetical protein
MAKKRKGALTDSVQQVEVVTLAVYLLGGGERSVDTEDVAIKAHELAPGRFSWKKYPEQVNLELVRVYLSDGKKEDRGELLIGSGRTGWSLTPAGLEWARSAAPRLLGKDMTRTREEGSGGSVDEQRWRRERSRVMSTNAWARWKSGDQEVPLREAAEVFRIDTYAVGRIRSSKITRLRALFGDDPEVSGFLAHLTSILDAHKGNE